MAKNAKNSSWAIISNAGLFFCFFLFPIFVINSSLTGLLELKCENHKQKVFNELGESLKKLAPFNDERNYFHLMLQKVFMLAEESKDYKFYLKQAIKRLKSNYPGQLEFIVWDKNGQLIEELTDEKRFRFVLKKIWEVFSEVSKQIQEDENIDVKSIPVVKSSLNLVKQFLGRVFLPESLFTPYLKDGNASVILADYGKDRPYFWYHTGKNGGLLCFLTWEAIKGDAGLRKIINAVNMEQPENVLGFASLHNLSDPYISRMTSLKSQIIMALARYENTSEQYIETADTQTVVQVLNPHIRIFATRIKDNSIYRPKQTRYRYMALITAFYLFGLAILYLNFYLRKAFFSIRWRLLLLFLYANTAPLIVLGTIAYDYLQNKTIALKNDIHLESARLLRDIDKRFSVQTERYTVALNEFIKNLNEQLNNNNLDEQQVKKLKKDISAFNPDEVFLIEADGKVIFGIGQGGKNVNHSISYVKNIADAILKFHNGIIIQADKSDILTKISAPEHSDFVRNSIRDSRKIWPMSIGDAIKIGYWNLIGDMKNQKNNYFLMLLWNESSFQSVFINNDFKDIISKNKDIKLFARIRNKISLFPEIGQEKQIQSILDSAAKSGSTIKTEIFHENQNYIATSIAGKEMNQTCLLAMVSNEVVDAQINNLEFSMLSGTFLSLIITVVISLAFSRQFLSPIKDLGAAAMAVSKHDFRYRMNSQEKDEFGHLAQVMNRMIEGLGELEVARIVQESLLPEAMPEVSPFEVFGKSTVMTALGGDYFDFIQIDQKNFGVIIGDVAGHGISAALIMAMAKAGVKMSSAGETADPAKLLNSIHQVIASLRGKKLKRMMTFQYLLINRETGQVKFANAGHCYPLLLDKNRCARYIEHNGMPLGVTRAPKYQNLEFTIAEGETLILFTDGIVEAQNINQQVLDYKGLAEIAGKISGNGAEEIYQSLYNAYFNFAGTVTDDMTLIVIRRNTNA